MTDEKSEKDEMIEAATLLLYVLGLAAFAAAIPTVILLWRLAL